MQKTCCHVPQMCRPVRKKSGRSSFALAVWNSSRSRNCHSSSSSRRTTVCRREFRSWQMTHRVAPACKGRAEAGKNVNESYCLGSTCTLLYLSFWSIYLLPTCPILLHQMLPEAKTMLKTSDYYFPGLTKHWCSGNTHTPSRPREGQSKDVQG